MQRYYDTVTDQRGNALAGARVAVQSGGTNVAIYSDDGVTLKTNPMTTDASGGFSFYAANGTYDLVVTSASGVVSSLPSRVRLFDVADAGLATSAALAASSGASLVGFVQSGAGAVTTDLQARGRLVRWVEDYFIAGEADEGPSMQRAIDAVETAGGGTVKFKPGKTYQKSQAIDLKSLVNLWCEGVCYVENTAGGLVGFRNNTGTRIKLQVGGIHCTCSSGITGTIAWDMTAVSDSYMERLGCDSTNVTTTGFLEGIKVYTGTALGAYRNEIHSPFVRTLDNASSIGLNLSGVGGADEGANGTRVFGGQIRATGGTQAYIQGNNMLLCGVAMEGEAVIGVDVAADAVCTGNVITACRFEGVTSIGIRFGLLTSSNLSVGNLFTSGIPTKISDLSNANTYIEPSQIFLNRMGKGRFEAYNPLDVDKGVFLAEMSASGQLAFDARVTGDAYSRLESKGSGRLRWGSGAAATDVGFNRTGTKTLQLESGKLVSAVRAFADADATPDVSEGHAFTCANTGATTITNFDSGAAGHQITVLLDANTTVQHNANVKLAGGVDYVGTANDTLTLVMFGSTWYEKCRSVNG
jgi:hypothetical protein